MLVGDAGRMKASPVDAVPQCLSVGAARVGIFVLVCGAALSMSGCKSTPETAWQLMQQQQQEQALMRQSEDDADARRKPAEPELMLSVIREAQRQERYFASLAYIDAYQQKFGSNPRLALLRAQALQQTGQVDASERAYRALLGTDLAAQAWHGLGLIAGGQGQFDQAADNLSRAAKLAPTDAQILGDLGYARLRAGDAAGARVPLGQAAELAPESMKVLSNLAVLLLVEGNHAGAQRLMDQANLSPETRAQVLQLSSQIRGGAAASTAKTVAVPATATPSTVAAAGSVTAVSSSDTMVMPVMRPLMDRFSNTPLIR